MTHSIDTTCESTPWLRITQRAAQHAIKIWMIIMIMVLLMDDDEDDGDGYDDDADF